MATSKKALALADEIVSELRQRQSALAVTVSYDSDSNPLVRLGTGTAGQPGALFKVQPIDVPAAVAPKDVLGLTESIYTPHVIKVGTEANATATDIALLTNKLLALGLAVSKGTKVEWYESATGDSPDADDFIAGNLKATFEASAQYPLAGQ